MWDFPLLSELKWDALCIISEYCSLEVLWPLNEQRNIAYQCELLYPSAVASYGNCPMQRQSNCTNNTAIFPLCIMMRIIFSKLPQEPKTAQSHKLLARWRIMLPSELVFTLEQIWEKEKLL